MAAPSEPFTWKLFGTPLHERQCAVCEKPLRVMDVRKHETLYRYDENDVGHAVWLGFYCKDHYLGRAA